MSLLRRNQEINQYRYQSEPEYPNLLRSFCEPNVDEENVVGVKATCYLAGLEDIYTEDARELFHGLEAMSLFRMLCRFTEGTDDHVRSLKARRSVFVEDSTRRFVPTSGLCVYGESNILLMMGEENSGENMGIPTAISEMQKAVPVWNPVFMGDLPFLLCYATAGPEIQICVLDPQLQLHEVFPRSLNLTNMIDRLAFYRTLINCFRIFRANSMRAAGSYQNRSSCPLFTPIQRPNSGCILYFNTKYVRKTYLGHGFPRDIIFNLFPPNRLETLTSIFGALICIKPKFLECPILSRTEYDYDKVTVDLVPLGYHHVPKNEEEFRQAMRCVLMGLKELHSVRWVHLDVRWANVLRKSPSGDWFLVDFDRAQQIGDANTPNTDLSFAADHLFLNLPECAMTPAALKFQIDLRKCKTADQALKHPWLKLT